MMDKTKNWFLLVFATLLLGVIVLTNRPVHYPNAALEMPRDALHVQIENDSLWVTRQLNRPDGSFDFVLERHPLTDPTKVTQIVTFHGSAE